MVYLTIVLFVLGVVLTLGIARHFHLKALEHSENETDRLVEGGFPQKSNGSPKSGDHTAKSDAVVDQLYTLFFSISLKTYSSHKIFFNSRGNRLAVVGHGRFIELRRLIPLPNTGHLDIEVVLAAQPVPNPSFRLFGNAGC